MNLHRFIGDFAVSGETEIIITDPKIIKQMRAVLRFDVGDRLALSDGKGKEQEVLVASTGPKEIVCQIVKKVESKEPARKVHLYLAILKKENFELAVQKAVEGGASKITPVITERTIKTRLNFARLEKIIKEASEQSGRNIVPTLSPISNFQDALLSSMSEEKNIFHLVNLAYTPNPKAENVDIFVGPEGGFTEKEIELAKNSGFRIASLGSLTLRGETAAIIGTYRAVYAI